MVGFGSVLLFAVVGIFASPFPRLESPILQCVRSSLLLLWRGLGFACSARSLAPPVRSVWVPLSSALSTVHCVWHSCRFSAFALPFLAFSGRFYNPLSKL